ncbi:DUF2218 domain-containing protein [Actinomyces sp. MRS3W]|uniref:DUF2218 domain-containing protein n=1 Tax=Actinomyces sp. MRS3W TaxID=2800796 RepID=UPI0028FD231D|nr:DUF2218 domain-containing protein [Actinomyces sp. MRS3W]MDU0347956.1 DUF2218 domain-containing protein [Actinomyces sp. MRS3W]
MTADSAATPASSVFDHRSVARVDTDRPDYYGRRLVDHMNRKIDATWDDATTSGRLAFNREGAVVGVVDLTCEEKALILTLSTSAQEQPRLEEVVGIHLARFGYRDSLAVSWIRDGGSVGTMQGPLSAQDMERMRREYEARQRQ